MEIYAEAQRSIGMRNVIKVSIKKHRRLYDRKGNSKQISKIRKSL